MWSTRKVETSLTFSPPTSMRSNAASTTPQVVREQTRLQAEVAVAGARDRVDRVVKRSTRDHRREQLLAVDPSSSSGRRRSASAGRRGRRARRRRGRARRRDGLAQPLLDALGVAVRRSAGRRRSPRRAGRPTSASNARDESSSNPSRRLVDVDALHRDARLARRTVVPPQTIRSAAKSASASAATIDRALPPSSSVTRFMPARLFSAQPTAGLPVNVSSLMRSSSTSGAASAVRRRHDRDPLLGPAGLEDDLARA